jgi:hypothetical protein
MRSDRLLIFSHCVSSPAFSKMPGFLESGDRNLEFSASAEQSTTKDNGRIKLHLYLDSNLY